MHGYTIFHPGFSCLHILVCTSIHPYGNSLYHLYCFLDFKVASVLDIMQLTPLPKVICVLKSWKGEDVTSSVVENEVLIVKQVRNQY